MLTGIWLGIKLLSVVSTNFFIVMLSGILLEVVMLSVIILRRIINWYLRHLTQRDFVEHHYALRGISNCYV